MSLKSSLLLDLLALLLLTMSGTMFADFTRRLLNADPDTLGIGAIAFQAFLAVAATSSFTKGGWAALETLLGRAAKTKAVWRLALASILFAVIAPTWYFLPARLADRYNTYGYNLNHSIDTYRNGTQDYRLSKANEVINPEFQRAEVLRNYQRAISLDPTLEEAHNNSGRLLESFYRYDESAEQYRKAILAERADSIDLIPYANLSRVLLLKGDALGALRVIYDAQLLEPGFNPGTAPSLFRNRAWAEYDLGIYGAAEEDALRSHTAAATCFLAKAYMKTGKTDDAAMAWAKFQAQMRRITPNDPVVEPDCEILSTETTHAK